MSCHGPPRTVIDAAQPPSSDFDDHAVPSTRHLMPNRRAAYGNHVVHNKPNGAHAVLHMVATHGRSEYCWMGSDTQETRFLNRQRTPTHACVEIIGCLLSWFTTGLAHNPTRKRAFRLCSLIPALLLLFLFVALAFHTGWHNLSRAVVDHASSLTERIRTWIAST